MLTIANPHRRFHPEISEAARIARMRFLAALLDSSIRVPVLGIRIGLDPILGLWPIWGDLMAAALALVIVYDAWRLGTAPRVLLLMLLNIAIDTIVGLIPIVGDLFDIAWRANTRNLRLIGLEPATY